MSLVSSTIPTLVGGVSQQAEALRSSSQSALQENFLSSPVDGLTKRPPWRHRAVVSTYPLNGAFTHLINRDRSERYWLTISGGAIKVTDLDGRQVVVNQSSGAAYLQASNPSTAFSAVTVADYTFIVNKTVVVQKDTAVPKSVKYDGLVWVRTGNYATTYTVSVTRADGSSFEASYTTGDPTAGDTTGIAQTAKTETIAEALRAGLATGGGWDDIVRIGSTIYLRRNSNWTLKVTDSFGDQALVGVKEKVQRFTNLPSMGYPGFTVEVAGDQSSSFDNYFVTYEAAAGGAAGTWKETFKPGEPVSVLSSSMPHVLVREADGTFTFKPAIWPARAVGDIETLPWPSFVGSRINDVFFHRNRLGLLSDENVSMSQAGKFFTFWRDTMTAVLDTDPIDITASTTRVTILRHAVAHQQSLLFFADNAQFRMSQPEALTPRTAALEPTTAYEASLTARPVGVGASVFFCVERGNWTSIREYFTDADTGSSEAPDATSHVPRYIPAGAFKLAASPAEDILAVASSEDRGQISVYKFLWSGSTKVLSSWSRFTLPFGFSLVNMEFMESDLYAMVSDTRGTYLWQMSLDPGRVDVGQDYVVHLDHRLEGGSQNVRKDFDPTTGVTTVTIPYDASGCSLIASGDGTGPYKPHSTIRFTSTQPGVFTVKGDIRDGRWFFGRPYVSRYRFSRLSIREQRSGGTAAVEQGRLGLRRMTLIVDRTGAFRTEVRSATSQPAGTSKFGRMLGSALIGAPAIVSGEHSFAILAPADRASIDIINDNHLPCSFLSAFWEGVYTVKSRRV